MEISNDYLIYRIYESIITKNGDSKWLLNIQNLWIDNDWEWRYQMITKYTEFMNRWWLRMEISNAY